MPVTSWVSAAPSATLHVDSTTGTSGEYPNVASPDFAKSLRVEVVVA